MSGQGGADPRPMVPPGLYVPLLTALTMEGEVNVPALIALADWVCERGAVGVVLFGTTGEGPSFSVDEKLWVAGEFVARRPGMPVIGSITENSLPEAIRLSRGYSELAMLAVMVQPPSYFRAAPMAGIRDFLKVVSDACRHPVLAYNIPDFAPTVAPSVVAELGLFGAKHSGSSVEYVDELVDRGLVVMIGDERILPEAFAAGATRAIAGMGNLMPDELVELCQAAVVGDRLRAEQLRDQVVGELARLRERGPELRWMAAMKQEAGRRSGVDLGGVRLPLLPVTS